MEHVRLRKYRGPEVWARVRIAYEQGEPGPVVARRYDVGLANLRKKARREGWSRRDQAAAHDQAATRTHGPRGEVNAPPLSGAEATASAAEAPNPAVPPARAVATAVARAANALAEGRPAEAAALLKAAETLARVAEVDPARAGADHPDTMSPEQDAAREAEARARWEGFLDLVEAQADRLARQMLADRSYPVAKHGGFVRAWRARHLGPEAVASDRAFLEAINPDRFAHCWDDAGQPSPVEQMRAEFYAHAREDVREGAGLPARAAAEG